jgi:hypothetical protein
MDAVLPTLIRSVGPTFLDRRSSDGTLAGPQVSLEGKAIDP